MVCKFAVGAKKVLISALIQQDAMLRYGCSQALAYRPLTRLDHHDLGGLMTLQRALQSVG
jgi:capsule polysaccharide export protein KpsC/LpsZ